MNKEQQILQEFFNNRTPSISLYKEIIQHKNETERSDIHFSFGQHAFGYWNYLSEEYQHFLRQWIKSHRKEYNDYLIYHTPIGENRLQISFYRQKFFISWLAFNLSSGIITEESYVHAASNILLCFNFNRLSLSSLHTYLHKKTIPLEDFLQLIGLNPIDDEYLYLS
ncbi:MAG: hypothetical protein LUH10_07010 [Tannerellaceae bacterium]|nr:hypothetical protein [Tannerellaceae bacterium]